ncbi:hypothetical protein J1N35_007430 [Gossypium stocksii]|uniref:Uncharacterized protein n=1 Tax=Gossypium stocksii TaxID=47602 RepID=A0A9D3W6Z6_9ROSI|nr:hypothetical protein J1N35_007430 [Gossypium stocksii]
MKLGLIVSRVKANSTKESDKKPVKGFSYSDPHKMRDSPKRAKSTVTKKGKEAEPDERKASKFNSMILTLTKRNSREVGLMYVDINISSQKKSAFVDTRASDLFISKKATRKLGLSINK